MDQSYSHERLAKLKVWKRNRDQARGADKVKAAARNYVRQNSKLSDEAYDAIMDSTEYFPMAARTLQSFVGLVFRKAPIFDGEDGFPAIVSTDGSTAEEFARKCFREYMEVNDGGILRDAPTTPDGATNGEVAKLKLYSYSAMYPAESIRDIRYQVVDGQKKLVYVRLVESEDHGRELSLIGGIYHATIWERPTVYDDKGVPTKQEWVSQTIVPVVAGKPLTAIPFTYLNDGTDGAAIDDLCAINVVHFNKSFRLSQAEAWVSSPVVVIAGVDDDVELDMSPGAFWRFNNDTAKWGFNEYKGDGVPLIERQLDRLEAHASMLGSRLLIQEKSVSEAEGTVARRQAGENSILASMARHMSAKLSENYQSQGEMMGRDRATIKYTLSTDFVPGHADPALVGQLLALRMANKIPDESFFESLQRLDIVDESWDYDQYMAALDIQGGADALKY